MSENLTRTKDPEILLEAKADEVEEILVSFRDQYDPSLFHPEKEVPLPIPEKLGPAAHRITRRREVRFPTNRGEIVVSATEVGDPGFPRMSEEWDSLVASLRLTLPGKREMHFGSEWRERFWAWLRSTPPIRVKH